MMPGTKLRMARGKNTASMMHWCPGCEKVHGIRIEGDGRPLWTFNGDHNKPTFTPSVRYFTIYGEENNLLPAGQERTLCHYFITDGQIQFCGDSPHALAGKTVLLPDWPYAPGTYGGIEE